MRMLRIPNPSSHKNVCFTQQSEIDLLLFTVLHSEIKKRKKSQLSQGRTSLFGADCIFIAAQKSKWERKANKEFFKNAFIFFDPASKTFEMFIIDLFCLFTGIIWVYYITII